MLPSRNKQATKRPRTSSPSPSSLSKQSNSVSQPDSDDETKSKISAPGGSKKARGAAARAQKDTRETEKDQEKERPETTGRRKGNRRRDGMCYNSTHIGREPRELTYFQEIQRPRRNLLLPRQLQNQPHPPNLPLIPPLPLRNQLPTQNPLLARLVAHLPVVDDWVATSTLGTVTRPTGPEIRIAPTPLLPGAVNPTTLVPVTPLMEATRTASMAENPENQASRDT